MLASFWGWLRDTAKTPSGIRDLLAIAAVPGALVAFWITVAQYKDSVNIARANTLIEMRKRYADLRTKVSAMAAEAAKAVATNPKQAATGEPPSVTMTKQQVSFLIFQEMETIWYMNKFRLLDDEMWKTYTADICPVFLNGDWVALSWDFYKTSFAQPFVEFVNAERATTCPKPK
jgi:hypothetical protein